ncbi:hypothetical protein BO221_04830 [Archangium sp. Cb G35]|uniref:hypothetical protein n=1 Tax=Archangium sp. Cb G35 TaxID=1920190 RepID=UPI0009368462|nr:hypothetical protein [Archangium sp. Cb G35]OJT27312.1 hypothetical protein BO221_04830 [Archangium sp. Cb G35]
MDAETMNDTPPANGAAAEQQAPTGGKRERKPPSAEAAKLAADKKRLKRQLEKLLASNDPDALATAAAKLAGEEGSAPSQAAPAALEKTEAAAPAPTAEETAAMVPVAQSVVAMLAAPLAGTRYDPMRPKPNPLGGEDIVPAKALTEALAPVLAKYLPAAITTPEGQLAMVTLMWLGPPTLELVMEKVGEDDKPSAEGAGTRAA